MSRSLAFAAAILMLVGAGCPMIQPLELQKTPPSSADEPQARPSDAGQGTSPGGASVGLQVGPSAAAKPYYIEYSADVVAQARSEGRPVVLYFWASWCPICKAEEPTLKARIEASAVPVAGFRVNFDTETSLKQQYRVPYQHTTIVLDAKGNETTRFTGPVSEAELSAAIAAAAGE